MVRELMHDPLFLGRRARPAGKEDIPIAGDLLETLLAHRETCVGMAGNMIGESVAIIAFFDGDAPMVMYNPEILKGKGNTRPRRAACPCWAAQERRSGSRRSRSGGRMRPSRPGSRPSPAGPLRSSSMRWTTARGS